MPDRLKATTDRSWYRPHQPRVAPIDVILHRPAGARFNHQRQLLRSRDIDAEALYTPGTSRDDLETRFGPGTFFWIYDLVPKDEFAAATIKAMISIRKPRPAAYEVFLRRSVNPGVPDYRDYVFYNDRIQVLYAARRVTR